MSIHVSVLLCNRSRSWWTVEIDCVGSQCDCFKAYELANCKQVGTLKIGTLFASVDGVILSWTQNSDCANLKCLSVDKSPLLTAGVVPTFLWYVLPFLLLLLLD